MNEEKNRNAAIFSGTLNKWRWRKVWVFARGVFELYFMRLPIRHFVSEVSRLVFIPLLHREVGTQFPPMGTQDLLPGGGSWITTMVPWQPWWWSTIYSYSIPLNWHQNGNTGESQSSTALRGGVGSWVLAELSENTTWNSCYLCSPHACQRPVSLASLLGDGNLEEQHIILRVSFIHVTLDLLFLSRAKKNDTVKDSKHIEDVLTFSLLTLCFFKSLPV